MSTDTPETTDPTANATGPFTAAPKAKDTGAEPDLGAKAPNSLLTRPTDHAARPGFRNPANKNSKAQLTAKKKK
jgi:hypothetical protein